MRGRVCGRGRACECPCLSHIRWHRATPEPPGISNVTPGTGSRTFEMHVTAGGFYFDCLRFGPGGLRIPAMNHQRHQRCTAKLTAALLAFISLEGAAAFHAGGAWVATPSADRTSCISCATPRAWGMRDITPDNSLKQRVEGDTRKTWKFNDISQDRVHLAVVSEGRPMNTDIQLWLGPDWTPFSLKAYSEDGKLRPIQTLVGTRNKAAMIEVKNRGESEFPVSAAANYASADMALLPSHSGGTAWLWQPPCLAQRRSPPKPCVYGGAGAASRGAPPRDTTPTPVRRFSAFGRRVRPSEVGSSCPRRSPSEGTPGRAAPYARGSRAAPPPVPAAG